MVCKKCKTVLPDEAKFCTKCGKPVPTISKVPGKKRNQRPRGKRIAWKKPKKQWIVLALAALIVCLLVAVVLLWRPWADKTLISSESSEKETLREEISDKEPERVTKLELSEKEVSLIVGEEAQLQVLISPEDIGDVQIQWSSDEPSVVQVKNGRVIACGTGSAVVTAEADGVAGNCRITVIEQSVESVKIIQMPKQKTAYVGDKTVDTTGLKLEITYNNGHVETVETGFEVQVDLSQTGKQTVTILYGDKVATYDVTVLEPELKSISIASPPKMVELFEGETLDITGLTLNLEYSNGQKETITSGFEYSPKSFQKAGTQTVRISYGGKTTDITVTVKTNAVSSLSVNYTGNRTYYIGDSLQASDLQITAKLTNGTEKTINSADCQVDYDFSAAGSKKIRIAYGGKYAEVTMSVEKPSVQLGKGNGGSDKLQMSASTRPSGQRITWSLSDSSVAKISENGLLTAKQEGSVTVRASFTYQGREYYATEEIFVNRVATQGIWSEYQDQIIEPTDTLLVEEREVVVETQYYLAHYCTSHSSGTHSYFTSYTNQTDDATFNSKCAYHEVGWVNSNEISRSDGNGTSYWEYETGHRESYEYGGYKCANTCYLWYIMDTQEITKTQYRSCPVTVNYVWA